MAALPGRRAAAPRAAPRRLVVTAPTVTASPAAVSNAEALNQQKKREGGTGERPSPPPARRQDSENKTHPESKRQPLGYLCIPGANWDNEQKDPDSLVCWSKFDPRGA